MNDKNISWLMENFERNVNNNDFNHQAFLFEEMLKNDDEVYEKPEGVSLTYIYSKSNGIPESSYKSKLDFETAQSDALIRLEYSKDDDEYSETATMKASYLSLETINAILGDESLKVQDSRGLEQSQLFTRIRKLDYILSLLDYPN